MTEEDRAAFENSPATGTIREINTEKLGRAISENIPFPNVTPVPVDVELVDLLKERLVVVGGNIDDLDKAIKDMMARRDEYDRARDILQAALDAAKADPKFVDVDGKE